MNYCINARLTDRKKCYKKRSLFSIDLTRFYKYLHLLIFYNLGLVLCILLNRQIAEKSPVSFFYFLTAAAKQYNDDLERLQKDLFANYSTNIIPQKVQTIAVKVKFDIALNQIIDLVSFSAVRRNCLNLIHTEWSLLGFYVFLPKGVCCSCTTRTEQK